ncbi:F-box protein At4g22280-like isoform X1 [Silene latifolia]|uniref:F-box protein At4g22280-like isoform X1 n=1 Tax=Silene latifolia TaxID=37657 RepID=UPI003D78162C
MMPDSKKSKHGQLNPEDRLSDLPDFIMHHIISFLDFKEACRTCILSRRWTRISDTNPVLLVTRRNVSDGNTASLEYIETRMQRYSKENLRIKKLRLEFSRDVELTCKVDEWLEIAVRNQVENLVLDNPYGRYYRLTGILLSAKSLRTLDCTGVKIPYYKDMNPSSLESLFLFEVAVKERMLNQITSSCLSLKHLGLSCCSGCKSIVIPRSSTLETLYLIESLPFGGTVVLETPSLEYFKYLGSQIYDEHWPVISKPSFLRNLRKLKISYVSIADDVLSKLLSELNSLEVLKLCSCRLVSTIRISSSRLREIHLYHCDNLLDVLIDAPRLNMFKYKGEFYQSSSIALNSQAGCDISLHTIPNNLQTEGFVKLKKLMSGLSSCNVLKVLFIDDMDQELESDDVKFNNKELGNIQLGPPCYVKELKLTLSSWILSKSSLSAFLDGLFWICHPEIISIGVCITSQHLTIEPLISKLEDMARCWRHPLKRVEVGGANCSKLLKSRKLDVKLKLFW